MSTSATGTGTLSFTGVSSYSSDFQTILQREVAIAKLPLTSLQNQQADLLTKKTDLASLSSVVAGVGSAISALGTLGASRALGASSSNSSLVSVQNSGATTANTYTISNITSIATAASETSTTGYANNTTPVSADGNLSLTVGSKSYAIVLDSAHNNVLGLRDAINALGAPVTASVLTTGSNGTYLSVTANSTGKTTLQLNDTPASGGSTNLLTSTNQGTDAVFQLNGVPVDHPTNNINDVVSGLTFNILGTTAANQTVSLTLGTDPTQLSSALQTFASSYNALVDQVNSQVGTAAGSLNGDYLINQVESDLQQTVGYAGSNSIKGLATLGLTLDTSGKITFDQKTFDALGSTQISDAFSYLGSSSTGFGSLAQKFTTLSDPISGLIQLQTAGLTAENQTLTDSINRVTDRVSTIQNSVTLRLQAADAAIASLQSQQTVITASIQANNVSLLGKNYGSSG
jgi:flagellar hook-associated protein 2